MLSRPLPHLSADGVGEAAKSPKPEALARCCVHIANGSGYGQAMHTLLDQIMVSAKQSGKLKTRLGRRYVYSAAKKEYYYFNKNTGETT